MATTTGPLYISAETVDSRVTAPACALDVNNFVTKCDSGQREEDRRAEGTPETCSGVPQTPVRCPGLMREEQER